MVRTNERASSFSFTWPVSRVRTKSKILIWKIKKKWSANCGKKRLLPALSFLLYPLSELRWEASVEQKACRVIYLRGVFVFDNAPEVCKRCQVTRQYENCVTPDLFPHSFVLPIYSDCKCLAHIYDIQSSLADWSYVQMNRDLTESTSFSSNTSETNSRSLLFAKFLCPLSAIGNDFASQDEEVSLLSGFR